MLIPGTGLSRPAMSWVNRMAETFDRSLPWVLAVWFTGAILLLCRLNMGLIIPRRMRSIATQQAAVELQRVSHDLSRQLAVVRFASCGVPNGAVNHPDRRHIRP
jgi:hypothetical protein